MEINELLNRYFEGETSADEERLLRAFFASDKVPPELDVYRPLFAFWEEETHGETLPETKIADIFRQGIPAPDELDSARAGRTDEKRKSFPAFRLRTLYGIAGLAASVCLVLGIKEIVSPVDPCFCSSNYVVINGRCYTDIHKVRQIVRETLQEVSTPVEAYFPGSDETADEREILDSQLEELRALFNENE